ncbi:MAG: DUF4145 domain-containing protein [Proteobacteria bacterium]|nr:DUF4145 domain-containing protein [Pseudomonadota bacterium]
MNTYEQAAAAESYGLSEICGGGYRKALEILVKDYLIGKCESLGVTEDAIKELPLGQCIENYVVDPMTKAVAKRAAWLGNDETHYTRKWVENDLDDLKTLIKIVINAIDSEVAAGEDIQSMDPGNQS